MAITKKTYNQLIARYPNAIDLTEKISGVDVNRKRKSKKTPKNYFHFLKIGFQLFQIKKMYIY